MLAFNSIKYYSSLITQLDRLEKHISFIENNNPVLEKKEILKKIMKSELGFGSSSSISYIVKRETNGGSETLLKSYMDRFQKFKSNFDFMAFIGDLREVSVVFTDLSGKYLFIDECFSNLLTHMNDLAGMYQTVFQSDDRNNIVLFFDEAEKVCFEYRSIKKGLLNFVGSLESQINDVDYDAHSIFELQLLDVNFTVGEFGDTLSLIEDAYNEIKMLIKDKDVSNLQIIKIESGSLLTKLIGEPLVIALLVLIVKTIAKEMYQKFSVNGQIEKQSNIMKMISSSADIINKLDEMGINTGKSKSDLKDILNITTNNIYKILSRSGKIMLNDEMISIGDEQKLLEYKTLYLSTTLDEEGSEKSD